MARRWLLAAAVLAAAVFLATWLVRSGGRGARERRATAESPAAAPGAASAPEVERALAPAVAGGGRSERASEDGAPAAKEAAEAPAEETRVVQIVEAGTLRPVPGAEVGWRGWSDAWNPLAIARYMGLEDTRRVVADERGLATLAWPARETLLVLARGDGLCGGGPVEPPRAADDVARVELHRDWDVGVEVLDAAGRPASGVPVALTLRKPSYSAVEHLRTDAEGRARWRHVGAQFALQQPSSVVVALALPLSEPEERALEPDVPPPDPIRFRLPPSGAVALALVSRSGAPAPDGTRVQLAPLWPGETRNASPFADGREREPFDAQSVGGRVRFEHVELGAELEATVTGPTLGGEERRTFPGPTRAGELVERTIVLGEDRTSIVVRVLEGSEPLEDEAVDLELEHRASSFARRDAREARTDGAGRFELSLAPEFAEGDERSVFVSARDGALGARLDLSRPFAPETVDLGDLVLEPAPLLIGGRVLDAAGEPLAGASLSLELGTLEERGAGAPEYVDWQRADVGATSDERGAFELRRFAEVQRVRAWAELPGRRSESVEVVAGASDVVLTVRTTGSVAGALLVDAGVPLASLRLRLSPAGAPGENDPRFAPLGDGRFRHDALAPGRYDLAVGLDGSEEELARVEGLEVRSGETCEDPRIAGIDLRGRVRAIRILLRAPSAGAPLSGDLVYHASGEASSLRWLGVDGPVLELATAAESIDGTLSVHGFRRVALREVAGEHEVELRPALAVRLVLPPSIELPEPPLYVKAVLTAPGDDSGIDWGAPAFDAGREIVVNAPDSGPMRVCWIVERRAGGGASATTLALEPQQMLVVRELDAEQRFALEVSDEALRRALEQSGMR